MTVRFRPRHRAARHPVGSPTGADACCCWRTPAGHGSDLPCRRGDGFGNPPPRRHADSLITRSGSEAHLLRVEVVTEGRLCLLSSHPNSARPRFRISECEHWQFLIKLLVSQADRSLPKYVRSAGSVRVVSECGGDSARQLRGHDTSPRWSPRQLRRASRQLRPTRSAVSKAVMELERSCWRAPAGDQTSRRVGPTRPGAHSMSAASISLASMEEAASLRSRDFMTSPGRACSDRRADVVRYALPRESGRRLHGDVWRLEGRVVAERSPRRSHRGRST